MTLKLDLITGYHVHIYYDATTKDKAQALSKVVETMRSTRQTSEWMESLGPFFVGRVLSSWRKPE